MIEDNNCVCTCGFDCQARAEDLVNRMVIDMGEPFACPNCGKLLQLGYGDEYDEQTGDTSDTWYTSEAAQKP